MSCTTGSESQWKHRAAGVSPHLFLSFFCLSVCFVLCACNPYRCVQSHLVCVFDFALRIFRQDAVLSRGFSAVLLLRVKVQHFTVPFAEVDAMALHTGWASIILSYCKVICTQTKVRKSNLLRECCINLGGRGPWQCTAGAKLAWLYAFFFYVFQVELSCSIFYGVLVASGKMCHKNAPLLLFKNTKQNTALNFARLRINLWINVVRHISGW